MLTADAGQLPSGEWAIQIIEDGRAIEALPLGFTAFPPITAKLALVGRGYEPQPWPETRDNLGGWHMTEEGYTIELTRLEAA